tara:strand:+ start:3580 stop:3822 length:243 start_codon:yes stop_codon:yes gene_type:complete
MDGFNRLIAIKTTRLTPIKHKRRTGLSHDIVVCDANNLPLHLRQPAFAFDAPALEAHWRTHNEFATVSDIGPGSEALLTL